MYKGKIVSEPGIIYCPYRKPSIFRRFITWIRGKFKKLLDNDEAGWGIGIVAVVLFVLLYATLTPSTEQMTENDYYAMMEARPKCIDTGDVSLGCKKDYIDWQKDSIKKQHEYDSVKVKLENLQNKIIQAEDKTGPTDSVSVKPCIDSCWTKTLNADIKKCQDECFK